MGELYVPEVDDYVIWERETWMGPISDEGWIYFKAPIFERKKGFGIVSRYITIETGIRPKPKCQLECTSNGRKNTNPHKNIHTLLLCYENNWSELKYIKKRESKIIQHWSQYDDRAGFN